MVSGSANTAALALLAGMIINKKCRGRRLVMIFFLIIGYYLNYVSIGHWVPFLFLKSLSQGRCIKYLSFSPIYLQIWGWSFHPLKLIFSYQKKTKKKYSECPEKCKKKNIDMTPFPPQSNLNPSRKILWKYFFCTLTKFDWLVSRIWVKPSQIGVIHFYIFTSIITKKNE